MPTITLYKHVTERKNGWLQPDTYVFERIKNGRNKQVVEKIRAETDTSKKKLLKEQLPVYNFQGIFSERNAKGLEQFSGLVILDFDKFSSDLELQGMKQRLSQDKFVYACFVSPSGDGLKVLVRVPQDGHSKYKLYFDSLKAYFNSPNFDAHNSDISRLCFESYDPEIHINLNSEIYEQYEEPEYRQLSVKDTAFPLTSDHEKITRLTKWWDKKFGFVKGSRHQNIFILACSFNDYGVHKSVALNELLRYEQTDFKESEIEQCVNSAYAMTHKFGTETFEDLKTKTKVETLLRKGIPANEIISQIPNVNAESVKKASDSIKNNIEYKDFVNFDKNGKCSLTPHKYKYWLESNNFSKFFPTESKIYTFVKINQNIVEETDENRIKDFVLDYLLTEPEMGMKQYDYMALSEKAFQYGFLSLLESAKIKMQQDTKDSCFLYFQNCVVKITADSIEKIEYIDIDGYVWKNQIINRDYIPYDHHKSDYRKFVWLISGGSKKDEYDKAQKKYNTFKSVIGFLLHSYKISATNKAIILNDSVISDNPNGRSGKSLFWNALSNMKKLASIDCKLFDPTDKFKYQLVSNDCQLLVFDDVKKNFDFEQLFSLITEGLTIEYKNQRAIKLPISKSPKIVITTNYTLGGTGGSHKARKFEVELSDYFSVNYRPIDEFGRMFFDEWTNTDWAMFDNYMIQCVQYYLKYGLVESEFDNITTRKFIRDTSSEFYEWTQDHKAIKHGEKYDKDKETTLYNMFITAYPDLKVWLKQRAFKKWIELYCDFYGFTFAKSNTNSIGRYFQVLSKGVNPEIEINDEDKRIIDNNIPF